MKKVILYEHGSSLNHGCEAIVRSTCDVLGLNKSNAVLYTNDYISDVEYGLNEIINVSNAYKLNIFDILKKVLCKISRGKIYNNVVGSQNYLKRRHSAVISIGGDNYCYVGLIPHLIKRHATLKQSGNITILWGASFKNQLFSEEVIEDLKSYDLITVRESVSAKYLYDAGIKNYLLSFDSAFTLKTEDTPWPDNKSHKYVVGINLSPLIFCYANKDHIMNNFIGLINYIIKNTDFEIAFIPHVTSEGTDDRKVLSELKSKFFDCERILMINDNYNCCQIKSLISKCRFFIGSRTHATIAAYSSMVPTCVLGYSAKSVGIALDLFGTTENYVLDATNLNDYDLINSFAFLLKNENSIKETLQEVVSKKIELLSSVSEKVKKQIFQD